MRTLSDLLAAHREKAEAASVPNGCRRPRGIWRVLYGSVVAGRGGRDYFTVCREDSFSAFGGRTLAHIAANDPDTILALLDVVEAAEKFVSVCECYNGAFGARFDTESALDNLTSVLGGEQE